MRASHFRKEATNINKQFKGTKILISNSYLIRKRFQGYRGKMISLYESPLDITRTVPLIDLVLQKVQKNKETVAQLTFLIVTFY